MRGVTLFDTALGRCGVAWGPGGLRGVSLPAPDEARMRARLARRAGVEADDEAEAPAPIAAAIEAIRALMAGEKRDLADVALDMSGTGDFERAVYAATRAVKPARRRAMARSPRGSARRARRRRWGGRSAPTRGRSSCPATASPRRTGRCTASRRRAGSRPSAACW